METNNTDNPITFPWPSAAQSVLEGQIDYLAHLEYEGPAPKTFHEANDLIEDLLRRLPDEPQEILHEYDYERNEDGFTWGEMEYARMMHLRKKEEQK